MALDHQSVEPLADLDVAKLGLIQPQSALRVAAGTKVEGARRDQVREQTLELGLRQAFAGAIDQFAPLPPRRAAINPGFGGVSTGHDETFSRSGRTIPWSLSHMIRNHMQNHPLFLDAT